MTVEDEDAINAMRLLANPNGSDPAVVAGESGGVGLAAFAKIASNMNMREQIGLDARSRVFLINTEGATDPKLYREFVGETPEHVLAKNGQRAA